LLTTVGSDAFHQRRRVIGIEDFGVQFAQPAMEPDHGGLSDRDMQVTRLELNDRGQQFIDHDLGCHNGTSTWPADRHSPSSAGTEAPDTKRANSEGSTFLCGIVSVKCWPVKQLLEKDERLPDCEFCGHRCY